MIRVSGVVWFTNLDINKRHEDLILYKEYYSNEDEYSKYENYNAINVNKVAEIPTDYKGAIGVLITLLSKYNWVLLKLMNLILDIHILMVKKFMQEY